MKKKIISIILTSAMVFSALCSCGSNQDQRIFFTSQICNTTIKLLRICYRTFQYIVTFSIYLNSVCHIWEH